MLQSKLIGETKKEWPSEASTKSHGLLIKGGYVKQMASGIYTLLSCLALLFFNSLTPTNVLIDALNIIAATHTIINFLFIKCASNHFIYS